MYAHLYSVATAHEQTCVCVFVCARPRSKEAECTHTHTGTTECGSQLWAAIIAKNVCDIRRSNTIEWAMGSTWHKHFVNRCTTQPYTMITLVEILLIVHSSIVHTQAILDLLSNIQQFNILFDISPKHRLAHLIWYYFAIYPHRSGIGVFAIFFNTGSICHFFYVFHQFTSPKRENQKKKNKKRINLFRFSDSDALTFTIQNCCYNHRWFYPTVLFLLPINSTDM